MRKMRSKTIKRELKAHGIDVVTPRSYSTLRNGQTISNKERMTYQYAKKSWTRTHGK